MVQVYGRREPALISADGHDMDFGRVHGRVRSSDHCFGNSIYVEVALETNARTRVVREECVALPPSDRDMHDLPWWADQFTQETIGTLLAADGWEAIALAEGDTSRATTGTAVITYVVRRM